MFSITVTAAGSTLATGAASASAPMPVASSGEIPRYIRVSATVACYFKMGISSVAATANDALIVPSDSTVFHVPMGVTHFAAIQDAAAGKCNVVPLENV